MMAIPGTLMMVMVTVNQVYRLSSVLFEHKLNMHKFFIKKYSYLVRHVYRWAHNTICMWTVVWCDMVHLRWGISGYIMPFSWCVFWNFIIFVCDLIECSNVIVVAHMCVCLCNRNPIWVVLNSQRLQQLYNYFGVDDECGLLLMHKQYICTYNK